MDSGSWSAVVLAGGRGSRLGGGDKASGAYAGRALLERSLASVTGAGPIVVVGDERPVGGEVLWTREDPPLGGPVSGLYAGLALVPYDDVVVLAVDMPHVVAATVVRLREARRGHEVAVLVGPDRRRQLAFAASRAALERARPEVVDGHSVRALLARLDVVEVVAEGAEAHDVDDPSDLRGPRA